MERYIQINGLKIGKGCQYVFEDIEGIAGGDIRYTEDEFIDVDGCEIADAYFSARTFQIKGSILAKDVRNLLALKQTLIKVCNPKKQLEVYYFDGERKYYCNAIADGMPDFAKRIGRTMGFVIYIKIPSFYWQSPDEIETGIFKITPLLNNTFTFPGMFSGRVNRNIIENDGEMYTYPKIVLTCKKSNTSDIILSNLTTGKTIKIVHIMSPGEVVTIDMRWRTVISSTAGNLINNIDRTDDFWRLETGENDIQVMTENITAMMYHRNNYIGV